MSENHIDAQITFLKKKRVVDHQKKIKAILMMESYDIDKDLLYQALFNKNYEACCLIADYIVGNCYQQQTMLRKGETHLSTKTDLMGNAVTNYLLVTIISILSELNKPITPVMVKILEWQLKTEGFGNTYMKEFEKFGLAVLLKTKNPKIGVRKLAEAVDVTKDTTQKWVNGKESISKIFNKQVQEALADTNLMKNLDSAITAKRASINDIAAVSDELDKHLHPN